MIIKQIPMLENKYKIKCPYVTDKIGITVHNTANSAPAVNEIKYMINNDMQVSYHVAVDENEVIECIPFNRNTWNSGDGRGKGNMNTISIEICRSTSTDESLYNRAEENAIEYIAKLLKERGWGVDRVYKHQDWNGKYCPHKILDRGEWELFKSKIQNKLNGTTNVTQPANTNNKGDFRMGIYRNGSTPEPVYSDNTFTNKIGELFPHEEVTAFIPEDGDFTVYYTVTGTNKKKTGFVKWKAGLQ